jgi:ammonia channel protein AmtB
MKTAIACVLGILCGLGAILMIPQLAEIFRFDDPVDVFGWQWIIEDVSTLVLCLALSVAFFHAAKTELKLRRMRNANLSAHS